MHDKLQKSINLIRKTGDRLIIYDSAKGGEAYALMTIDQYEKIALGNQKIRNLTENELLDKINRDIAIWKNEQIDFNLSRSIGPDFLSSISEKNTSDEEFIPDELMYYEQVEDKRPLFTREKEEEDEKDDEYEEYREDKPKKHWKIPSDRVKGAEEVVEKTPEKETIYF